MITGGKDSFVRIWDVTAGTELQVIRGSKSAIQVMDLNHDETRLVTGCENGTVHTWDLVTGKLIRVFEGINSDVRALAWHPSRPFIVAGGGGAKLFVWNSDTGQLKCPPIEDQNIVNTVAFTRDGGQFAFGGYRDDIRIVDFESGQEIRSLRGHRYAIRSLQFDPIGRRLASLTGDSRLMIWDFRTPSNRLELPGHLGVVWKITITPDQKHVVTSDAAGRIVVRETDSAQIVSRWQGHQYSIYGLACTSSGEIVSVGFDGKLKVWNLSGENLHTFDVHNKPIYGAALLPDEKRILIADYNGLVKLIEIATGKELRTYETDSKYGLRVAVTSDGKQFVTGHQRALLRRWDMETGELLAEYKGNDTVGDITGLSLSKDDRYIAASGMDSTIRIWELQSGKLVHQLHGHSFAVRSLNFSHDSLLVASASMDGTVKVWSVEDGQELLVLPVPSKAFSVLIHPDGQRIFTGGDSGSIQIWDTRLWNQELRVQARARAVLKYWREQCTSLEDMISSLQNDKVMFHSTRQLAQEWAELFWKGQASELVAQAQQAVKDSDTQHALNCADRLRSIGDQRFETFQLLAEIYLDVIPLVHVDQRTDISARAKSCVLEALDLANFEQLLDLVGGPSYRTFRLDSDFLIARQQAAHRLWDAASDDVERIRQLAYSHYDLGLTQRLANDHASAIQHFAKAQELHAQRIRFDPEAYLPYAGITLCGNYKGLSQLELCQYDEAIQTFEQLLSKCDQVIEKGLNDTEIKSRRKTYLQNLDAAKYRQSIAGAWDDIEEELRLKPKTLTDRSVELAKMGEFDAAMEAMDQYLQLDLDDDESQHRIAGATYLKIADQLQTSVVESDSDQLESVLELAEIQYRQAVKLGWVCSDGYRNWEMMELLLERDGFADSVGLQVSDVEPENRSEWRTAQEWIDDPSKTNFSHFIQQSNGDWAEVGEDFSGKAFETRFELHRATSHFIELNKEGINIRVRLWPDKAFWGRISTVTNGVSKWNFLQTGGWNVSEN